ncbi:MAG: redoxin domain-containing protein [Gemmataceae bacterium]|nr:redoxin domain-containing protein [Gemmataceae bacterium]
MWQTFLAAIALGGPPVTAPAAPPVEAPHPQRLWLDAVFLAPLVKHAGPKFPWPESVRMLAALLDGQRPSGAGVGWFGPSQSSRGWEWLRTGSDIDGDGRVTRKEFGAAPELFDRLDRDRDGVLTADDFDWSPASPYVRQQNQLTQLLRQIDDDGDRRISEQEWLAYFKKLAKGKDHLTQDDLRALLMSAPAKGGRPPKGGGGGGIPPVMFRAFLTSDAGSPYPGPAVGTMAPNFTLPTHDRKGEISLADYRGKKLVVLIFGSFT